MANCNLSPFVKWAGGKTQLLDRLLQRMPEHYNTYYEPFIGGGALLLAVQPKVAIVNDINEQLVNVYKQLKENAEEVISAVNQLDAVICDTERYLSIRKEFNKKIQLQEHDAQSAALMIWINKHCFNGLYRVNSEGLFNVPFNNKSNGSSIDAENIRSIGSYLNTASINILHGDFEDACQSVSRDDFVYFDSPYVPESTTANFTSYSKQGFSLEDHMRLAVLFKKLDGIGAKLMLSNHNVPLVHELYSDFNIEVFNVRRAINSDASKREGKEVIITNYHRGIIDA